MAGRAQRQAATPAPDSGADRVLPRVRPGLPRGDPERYRTGRQYAARRDNDASGGDEASGYLFISDDQPWPSTLEQVLIEGTAAIFLADV